jgi:hypothetical protein
VRRAPLALVTLVLASLACGGQPLTLEPAAPPDPSPFDSEATAYGFFPSPPEATIESVLSHFAALAEHADFVLIQPNIPWEDLSSGDYSSSQRLTDVRNQVILARQNGLDTAFVVDPLNGLNRREFMGLPEGWEASFANPGVRVAFREFALWIAREFGPRYLGLASEINTYADAHPEDFPHYLSLYRETYAAIKSASPGTQVFVTFQWEDLNNLFPTAAEGRDPYQTNWDQVEAFEPELDLWVISSYPFVAFRSGAEIPDDYYSPLLERTERPLAVAEGGYTSEPVGPFPGTREDQVRYLEAIHSQLGGRLRFWVYLLLSDFDPDSYAEMGRQGGMDDEDIDTLGLFRAVGLSESDGAPKPALALWDEFRSRD